MPAEAADMGPFELIVDAHCLDQRIVEPPAAANAGGKADHAIVGIVDPAGTAREQDMVMAGRGVAEKGGRGTP